MLSCGFPSVPASLERWAFVLSYQLRVFCEQMDRSCGMDATFMCSLSELFVRCGLGALGVGGHKPHWLLATFGCPCGCCQRLSCGWSLSSFKSRGLALECCTDMRVVYSHIAQRLRQRAFPGFAVLHSCSSHA